MKGLVKYPFHVKHKGKRYGPGEIVEVDDVGLAVVQGAKAVEPVQRPPTNRSKAKAQ